MCQTGVSLIFMFPPKQLSVSWCGAEILKPALEFCTVMDLTR